jgi:hypothetical protein
MGKGQIHYIEVESGSEEEDEEIEAQADSDSEDETTHEPEWHPKKPQIQAEVQPELRRWLSYHFLNRSCIEFLVGLRYNQSTCLIVITPGQCNHMK